MRLATYNIEWFNNLFADDGSLLADDEWSGRQDVTRIEQLTALGIVFTALDADAVMIIEAPDQNGRRSTVAALEEFAKVYGLRTRKALMGFENETQQEIALLYDPDEITARHDPQGEPSGPEGAHGAPRFDTAFRWDLDTDATSEVVSFSKPPLEVAARTSSGVDLRLIGVHVKSKAPYGARGKAAALRTSIQNRRKQLAQCIWLRARVEEHLARNDLLVVLGDLNDGPGLDEYEKLFGHSGVEIVMGEDGCPCLHDPHAKMAVTQRVGTMPATARFYMPKQKRYLQALLDYVMISEALMAKRPEWRIWHPFDDPVCYATPELREALLTASDHFPVSVDLEL